MFNWKEVPKADNGFVNYPAIKSRQVRKMVAKAERVKLEEEAKARRKWEPTESNLTRLEKITLHLQRLDRMFT